MTHDELRQLGAYEFITETGRVYEELISSIDKHPLYPRDPVHRVAIMAEESGEATQASLDLARAMRNSHSLTEDSIAMRRDHLRKELVQTAAMCIKALIAMTREDKADAKPARG